MRRARLPLLLLCLLLATSSCGGCISRLLGGWVTGASHDATCGTSCIRVSCAVSRPAGSGGKESRKILVELLQELPSGAKNPMTLERYAVLEPGASGTVTADFNGVHPEQVLDVRCEDQGQGSGVQLKLNAPPKPQPTPAPKPR